MFHQPCHVTFHLAAEAPSHILPSCVEPTLASQAGLELATADGEFATYCQRQTSVHDQNFQQLNFNLSPISPTNKVHWSFLMRWCFVSVEFLATSYASQSQVLPGAKTNWTPMVRGPYEKLLMKSGVFDSHPKRRVCAKEPQRQTIVLFSTCFCTGWKCLWPCVYPFLFDETLQLQTGNRVVFRSQSWGDGCFALPPPQSSTMFDRVLDGVWVNHWAPFYLLHTLHR